MGLSVLIKLKLDKAEHRFVIHFIVNAQGT